MTDLQLPERAENSEPTAPKCWRDILPIHPAAELWPLMAPDELCALGEDLKANGMQVPISILHHEGYALLDGRNRLDALETVGLDVAALLQAAMNWEKIAELKVIYVQPPTGSNSVIASRKADPYDYVVSVNERRRHLTTAQRSEVAEKLLKPGPICPIAPSPRRLSSITRPSRASAASSKQVAKSATRQSAPGGTARRNRRQKPRLGHRRTRQPWPTRRHHRNQNHQCRSPCRQIRRHRQMHGRLRRSGRLGCRIMSRWRNPICWRGTKPLSGTLPSARPQSTTPAALPPKRSKAASITPPLNTPPSSTTPRFNRRLRARRLTTSRQESPMNSSRPRRTM